MTAPKSHPDRMGRVSSRAEPVGSWNPIDATALASNPGPYYYFTGFSSDIGMIPAWNGQPEAFIRSINDRSETCSTSVTARCRPEATVEIHYGGGIRYGGGNDVVAPARHGCRYRRLITHLKGPGDPSRICISN